ncbi:MAG: hypothetical protein AAFY73_06365 [Pseudomonadota bacterium]
MALTLSTPANRNDTANEPVRTPVVLRISDAMVMRVVFYALLGVTAVILLRDFQAMRASDFGSQPAPAVQPVLPALPQVTPVETGDDGGGDVRRAPDVVTDLDQLRQPLLIDLVSDGVLRLTGTIEPGSAARFAEKTAQQAEYVQVVELDSPGGSVVDALNISEAIREAGWNTRVRSGSLCASSCPLILSGGVERRVGDGAAVGVHQVFTTAEDDRSRADSISGTQTLTARIARHLDAMGVDGQVWVHALETPPQYLYYFTQDELTELSLATSVDGDL